MLKAKRLILIMLSMTLTLFLIMSFAVILIMAASVIIVLIIVFIIMVSVIIVIIMTFHILIIMVFRLFDYLCFILLLLRNELLKGLSIIRQVLSRILGNFFPGLGLKIINESPQLALGRFPFSLIQVVLNYLQLLNQVLVSYFPRILPDCTYDLISAIKWSVELTTFLAGG